MGLKQQQREDDQTVSESLHIGASSPQQITSEMTVTVGQVAIALCAHQSSPVLLLTQQCVHSFLAKREVSLLQHL